MKSYIINAGTLAVTVASLWLPGSAHGQMDMQPTYREMEHIVASQELTTEQKLSAISAYFAKEPYWPGVLYRLDKVDASRSREIALAEFRKPDTSRVHKCQLGNYLLRTQTPNLDRKPGDSPGFITEYRDFLIDAIVNGGKAEFCVPKEDTQTAVGEYAGIAGGINGPVGILFSDVADKRVIPVLIECLSAPDHVYPKEQGCVIRGKPGEPSGRNTQRQGIPLALMRLEATEAIPELQRIAKEHHDLSLRQNATKALDVLVPLAEKQKRQSAANQPSEGTR
jgi:hypothetical protein